MNGPSIAILEWIVLILATAAFCKYVLGYSHVSFIKMLFEELSDLLRINPSLKSINALAMVCSIIIAIAALFSSSFQKILNISVDIKNASSAITEYSIASLFTICIFTMMCILICGKLEK